MRSYSRNLRRRLPGQLLHEIGKQFLTRAIAAPIGSQNGCGYGGHGRWCQVVGPIVLQALCILCNGLRPLNERFV